MNRWFRLTGVLASLMLLVSSLASAAPQDGPKSYLVGFKDGKGAHDVALAGVRFRQEWSNLGAAHVEASAAGLGALRAHGAVEYVEEDRTVYALGHSAPYFDSAGEITWGLQAVHTEEAWALGARGAGRKVCILDTGIDYDHPEFARPGLIAASANFAGDGHPNAQDGHSHGTHVAGTIAAQPANGGVVGVAPDVTLLIARVLGDTGSGSTAGVINGLNWCVSQGANVASLSLGSSSSSRTEQKAFDSAYSKGVLTIAASGNDGKGRISYPANYSSVVAVGAVDNRLALASFSNYGKNQELVGPGVHVRSSVIRGTGTSSTVSEDGVGYAAAGLEFSGYGDATGPLVECGIADSAASCSGQPASGAWVALISRGTVSFSDKVQNVMAQGAAAAVITNNDTVAADDPGSFTLGTAGTWIPAVSVSYNSGVAIRGGGLGTGNAAVAVSDYAYFDGTSMATPHVSAVAAVAWSARPTLTNVQMRSVLQSSAKDLGAAGKDTRFGYGLVQADAAVRAALVK